MRLDPKPAVDATLISLGFAAASIREETSERHDDTVFHAVHQRGHRAVIAVERCLISGVAQLEGALARGWFRLRGAGVFDARRTAVAEVPFVVVTTKWFSSRSATRIATFIDESGLGSTCRWLVTDGERLLWTSEAANPEFVAEPEIAKRKPTTSGHRSPGATGFSDQFLVCAKTLLLRSLPGRWSRLTAHSSPVPGGIHSAGDLAGAAGVSTSQAHRFVSAFRRLGLLGTDGDEFEIVDRARLLRAFAERSVRQRDRGVRARLRGMRPDEWPRDASRLMIRAKGTQLELTPGHRFAVTGHRALSLHGLRTGLPLWHVVGAPLMIYVDGDVDRVARDLGFEIDDAPGWDALFVRPQFPESVWRFVHDLGTERSVPHVDIVQCAIDLVLEPFKGKEALDNFAESLPALFESADGGRR